VPKGNGTGAAGDGPTACHAAVLFINEEEMTGRGFRRRAYLKPWVFGAVAGVSVVFAEAFAGLYPPSAYAFCLTCHTRDLMNTLLNALGANFQTALLAKRVLMFTSPAVFAGALLGSTLSGEMKMQRCSRPLFFFIAGFFVMTVGLLIFGCPTRIAVRTGYGDLYGIVALAGMVSGVWLTTKVLRRIWTRGG
jgi:hypothetical protein